MEAVPTIDRDALVAVLERRFPDAHVQWSWVNRGYRSWTINVASGSHRVEIAWGPLSGFGGTDQIITARRQPRTAHLIGPWRVVERRLSLSPGRLRRRVPHGPPTQRTGVAAIVSAVQKLLGGGPGR
jgi:hypothetical protein